jgi:phosphoglycolate phosphatase
MKRTERIKTRLVLFDIDETLTHSDGVGRRAVSGALAKLFNIPPEAAKVFMSGKTDPQILEEIMTNAGMSQSEYEKRLPEFTEIYLKALERELESATSTFHLHEGVIELINDLNRHEHAFLGLLTGNIERGARLKMEKFGLNPYFPIGAFGSDAKDRMKLPEIAKQRAEKQYGQRFEPGQLVIIGDAENDILCAKGFGAKSLAINTGVTTREQLMALSPDFLFASLVDTKAILDAIFS